MQGPTREAKRRTSFQWPLPDLASKIVPILAADGESTQDCPEL